MPAEEVVPVTEDLYKATEADDVGQSERLLTERPDIVSSTNNLLALTLARRSSRTERAWLA